MNKTSDMTPLVAFSCDTPLPLSIATPFIIPDSPTRKDNEHGSSQNSLEDVVIPGLDTTNNSSTLCASKSIEIDPTSSNTVVHGNPNDETNIHPEDFEISYRVIGEGTLSPNVIHIDHGSQSQIPPGKSTTTTSSIRNDKLSSLKNRIDASTPYTGNAGSTKRNYKNLRQRLDAESPIGRTTGKILLPKDDEVYFVADSPQPVDLVDDTSQSSSKRKKTVISSTSSEENLSSNCESTTFGSLSKRKRKRVKTSGFQSSTTSTKTTPRKKSPLKNTRITVKETSQSSENENENVSESDSRSYYCNKNLSKNSPFSVTTSPSVASRRKSVESTPKVSAWLSAVDSPGLATMRKSTTSSSNGVRKKNSTTLKDKITTKRRKKMKIPATKNADFKRLLAQHIDDGENGDDSDDW